MQATTVDAVHAELCSKRATQHFPPLSDEICAGHCCEAAGHHPIALAVSSVNVYLDDRCKACVPVQPHI